MSHQTQEAYDLVFRYVHEHVISMAGAAAIVTDYEKSMRSSLKKLYPDAVFISCWFHFCQAVKKRTSKITKFREAIAKSNKFAKIYYMLLCLPLLPAGQIENAFNELKKNLLKISSTIIPKASVSDFLSYFENQWIRGPRAEGANAISVFQRTCRTTSAVESHNSRINDTIQAHRNIPSFCTALKDYNHVRTVECKKLLRTGALIEKSKEFQVIQLRRLRGE